MHSGNPAHKVLEGNKSYQEWGLGHACEILTSFCLCHKNPSEAELRDARSLCLAEDISRHERVQAGVEKQL